MIDETEMLAAAAAAATASLVTQLSLLPSSGGHSFSTKRYELVLLPIGDC